MTLQLHGMQSRRLFKVDGESEACCPTESPQYDCARWFVHVPVRRWPHGNASRADNWIGDRRTVEVARVRTQVFEDYGVVPPNTFDVTTAPEARRNTSATLRWRLTGTLGYWE